LRDVGFCIFVTFFVGAQSIRNVFDLGASPFSEPEGQKNEYQNTRTN
jgi:hypothetical protein